MQYINHTFKMAFYLNHLEKHPGITFIPPENCIANLFRNFIERHFGETKCFIVVEGLKVVSLKETTRLTVSIPLTNNGHVGDGNEFFMNESAAHYFARDIANKLNLSEDPMLKALAKNMVCGTGNIWA